MNKFMAASAAARKSKGMLPSYSSGICFKRHRPFEGVLLKGEYQNEKEVAAKKRSYILYLPCPACMQGRQRCCRLLSLPK